MKFAEYAPLARRTLKELPFERHLTHMAAGFTGEMGELIDAQKKVDIYGLAVDAANVLEEIGDICWYVINLCIELDVRPETFEELYAGLKQQLATRAKPASIMNDLLKLNAVLARQGMFLVEDPNAARAQGQVLLDSMWTNLAITAWMYDLDLQDAFDVNIKKLAARYGEKYSDYAALNRDLQVERAILDAGVDAAKGE